jgi:hypothetical protein
MIYHAFIDHNEETLNVRFDFEVSYDGGSFFYDYGNISGVHNPNQLPHITGEKYDKSLYSPEQIATIQKWLEENIDKIEVE